MKRADQTVRRTATVFGTDFRRLVFLSDRGYKALRLQPHYALAYSWAIRAALVSRSSPSR